MNDRTDCCTRPSRVVHIVRQSRLSGAASISVSLTAGLPRNEFEPVLIGPKGGDVEAAARSNGVAFFPVQFERSVRPWYDTRCFLKVLRIIGKLRPCIVHTHSTKTGLIGRMAAALCRIPVIIHTVQGYAFHEFSAGWRHWIPVYLERIIGKITDRIICVNKDDAHYTRRFKIVDPARLTMIPNGVHGFVAGQYSDAPAFPEQLTFVSVARLVRQKDPVTLVRAFVKYRDMGGSGRLWLVGDGPLMDEVERVRQSSEWGESIELFGWLPKFEVGALLAQSDVFVLSSLWEGLPLAALEAMSVKLPLILTDVKGNRELVSDGEIGWMVPPRNASALAATMLLTQNRASARKRRGRRAFFRFRQEFTFKLMRERVVDIYRREIETYNTSQVSGD